MREFQECCVDARVSLLNTSGQDYTWTNSTVVSRLEGELTLCRSDNQKLIQDKERLQSELDGAGLKAMLEYKKSPLLEKELTVLFPHLVKQSYSMALRDAKGLYPEIDLLHPTFSVNYRSDNQEAIFDTRSAYFMKGRILLLSMGPWKGCFLTIPRLLEHMPLSPLQVAGDLFSM